MNTWNNSLNNSFASMQQLYTQTAKSITNIKNTTNAILKKHQDLYSMLKTEFKNLKTVNEAQNKKICFVKFNDRFKSENEIPKFSIKCFCSINQSEISNNNNAEKSWLEKITEWLALVNNILDTGNSVLDIVNRIRDLFKSDKSPESKKSNKDKRKHDRKSNKDKNKSNKNYDKKSNKSNNKSFKSSKRKINSDWWPKIKKLSSSAAQGQKGVTSKVIGNLLTSGAARKGAMKTVAKAAPKVLMRALPWVARGAAKFVPGLNLLSLGYDAYSLYKYFKNKNAKNSNSGTQLSNANTMANVYPAISNNSNQTTNGKTADNNQPGFRDFNIAKIADTVVIREEADINRIAKVIAAKLESAKNNKGGRVLNGNLVQA